MVLQMHNACILNWTDNLWKQSQRKKTLPTKKGGTAEICTASHILVGLFCQEPIKELGYVLVDKVAKLFEKARIP